MTSTAQASDRDFLGYGSGPPRVRWPNDARLALSIVVNVEEGGELSISSGDERNEYVHEVVEELSGVRDLLMESHFEYGTRAGWARVRRALSNHGIKATLNAVGRSVETSPWLIHQAVADGHEVMGHSYRWESHAGMEEAHERAVIAKTVAAIAKAAGTPPVGWHTRSSTSVNTRRLLVEQGGFLYDSNAYNDDIPYVVEAAGQPFVVLPYAFDTNDLRFTHRYGFVLSDDFFRYCAESFDRLFEESADQPRMMSVGVHLRIIGRPGRISGLERFIAYAASKPGVWFARRDEIAHAWRAGVGLPRWQPKSPVP
jgi:allantoinase